MKVVGRITCIGLATVLHKCACENHSGISVKCSIWFSKCGETQEAREPSSDTHAAGWLSVVRIYKRFMFSLPSPISF